MLALVLGIALAGGALTIQGCNERKPIPVYTVIILGNGSFLLDQQRMDHAALMVEMQRRASDPDVARPDGGPRALVRITLAGSAEFSAVQEMVNDLSDLGYRNVETAQ